MTPIADAKDAPDSLSSPFPIADDVNGVRESIIASFAPRVSVLASEDTDDIARGKGFVDGIYGLLRPFGEDIPGKVVVRDSIGASIAWENFGIRLVHYGKDSQTASSSIDQPHPNQQIGSHAIREQCLHLSQSSASYEQEDPIDALLEHSLPPTRPRVSDGHDDSGDRHVGQQATKKLASAYTLYLRKLLSGTHQVPYETFTHPVACIIAVSSRSQAPLEKIRQLYSASGRGNINIPPWVGVDHLRYYVLVHDEDRDEIAQSTALFDLMKRHFGLHCYLLRLRSTRCLETDDDSMHIPQCEWMSADEDLAGIRISNLDDGLSARKYIFDSDAAAIRAFIRELVTQSIVPFMENRVVTWNDQVASKRRGIGGRFMSLSKRWAGFGSSKGSNPTTVAGSGTYNSNFDPAKGYYSPDAPEAIMRQLADYAFMLKDFKFAFSTYESIRSDFNNDRAWLYHASATELACISYLLIPQTLSNRSRSEMVDQRLDAALYSYLTRASMPCGAVHSIIPIAEILMSRGPAAAEDATKWAIRLLDLGILTPIPQALLTERIADIRRSQGGTGGLRFGSRRRQSVLWNTLASALWARLNRPTQASYRLREARTIMSELSRGAVDLPFPAMRPMYTHLDLEANGVREEELLIDLGPASMDGHDENIVYEANERLDQQGTLGDPRPADAGGFSAIEANFPGFETTQ